MKLRLKFNLVLIVVFAIGLAAAGAISHRLLQENARDEVLKSAGLIMESALSVRKYTVDQIRPHLERLPDDVFFPQTVPAYAATEVFEELRKKLADYSYKEATLNPTNPRDRATDWEADIVQRFRQGGDVQEIISERETATGRQLYIARPIKITNPACLQCHTTADMAPAAMVRIYGPANGFGWKLNEVVGAQVVTVPMDVPRRNADRAFTTFMASLAGVFLVVFIVINVMLSFLIVRPIRKLSESADKISTGDFSEPEFADKGKDEVAVLAASFNRMRRSLAKAIQMIDE
ncbi:c-type heme family protein [Variovorax sp. VNK109]|uniref:Tll0287-like domain-containing protein n=1 Tax=Variovorax sp. VNK109 TaxID=3400919 RepID=UPI003C07AED2